MDTLQWMRARIVAQGIVARVEDTGGGVMAIVVKAPLGEVVVTQGSIADETAGYAVVTMAPNDSEPEAFDTAGWGDMVDHVERCVDALTPVVPRAMTMAQWRESYAAPFRVHGIDPADGLALCATGTTDPTLTADESQITCDACRDAL